MDSKVIIVGAGLTGLSAGIYLQKKEYKQKYLRFLVKQAVCAPHGIEKGLGLMAAFTGW